ncbi:MAG: hypothetical protein V3W18_14345 [candidate division Zixibacteria bacterium]
MSQDLEIIIKEMDILWQNLLNCRAYFPASTDTIIGQTTVLTAPYYRKSGLKIRFCFDEPLTRSNIDKINDIGHWINQNFVIRLFALLDSHNVLSDLDSNVDGFKDIDIIKRLRNIFAHSSGKYNPRKSKHKKILRDMEKHLVGIKIQDIQDFPLAIETVLQPLFNGCRRYVEAKFKAA